MGGRGNQQASVIHSSENAACKCWCYVECVLCRVCVDVCAGVPVFLCDCVVASAKIMAAMRKRQERQEIYIKLRKLQDTRMLQSAISIWCRDDNRGGTEEQVAPSKRLCT